MLEQISTNLAIIPLTPKKWQGWYQQESMKKVLLSAPLELGFRLQQIK